MPFITPSDMDDRKVISSTARYLTKRGAKSSLISFGENDILFGAMRPYFHKVCLAPFSGTTRSTVFVFQPIKKHDLSFCLFLLSEKSTIDYATHHSVGSTIPYAKWHKSLANMSVVVSPHCIRESYHWLVWPIVEKVKGTIFENNLLAQLRDTLLPKLISGELRISEAEAQVEEVVR